MNIRSSCLKLRATAVVLLLLLTASTIAQQPKPLPAPASLRPLLGEYVHDNQTVIVFESDGKLYAVVKGTSQRRELSINAFSHHQLTLDNVSYKRQPLGPEPGATQLKVT